jgi:hypothetical protein
MTPFTVINAWEMLSRFAAGNCPETFASLMQMAQVSSYAPPAEEIPKHGKDRIGDCLFHAMNVADQAQAKRAFGMIKRMYEELDRKVTHSEFQWFVHQLLPIISEEMHEQLFFIMSQDGAFYGQEKPFGEAVWNAFPSARIDVTEAANCFALDRHSASVHHSMCALEPGLGALAADVGVSVGTGAWKNVIDQIEKAIKGLDGTLPSGPAKSERLQFLSAAASEFRYFKDGWRNHVAHARTHYDRNEAILVLDHAKTFMQQLASRLHE